MMASPLTSFLLGATPFVEAWYAIPFAVLQGFSPGKAFLYGRIGNMLPVIPLLLFLNPFSRALSGHSTLFCRFFDWLFTRTWHRGARFERWGTLALFLFVAVPLLTTGAWSGCAAVFVLGIRFSPALLAISAGTVVAALITTLPPLGITVILGGVS